MMTKIRSAAQKMAERHRARRNFHATAHLDAHILKDIGVTRDEWIRRSYYST